MKYSLAGRSCHLSPEKCQYFHKDMGYVTFTSNIDTCLRWASITEVDMSSAIGSQSVNKPGQVFVVRGMFNGDVIPGKYADGRAYHTVGGAQVRFDEPELLIIRDGCTVQWVLYDSATLDPFPTDAVVGGWLQGAPLYVARKYQQYFDPYYYELSVGYYDKAAGLGHMGWGVNDVTMTSVEILVLRDWDHDNDNTSIDGDNNVVLQMIYISIAVLCDWPSATSGLEVIHFENKYGVYIFSYMRIWYGTS